MLTAAAVAVRGLTPAEVSAIEHRSQKEGYGMHMHKGTNEKISIFQSVQGRYCYAVSAQNLRNVSNVQLLTYSYSRLLYGVLPGLVLV